MCGIFAAQFLRSSEIQKSFATISYRGPDDHRVVEFSDGVLAFHRLSIMDLTSSGMQPFEIGQNKLICNGEIYNYLALKNDCSPYQFHSHSDCEVLLPLYEKWGIKKLVENLDGEFAFVLWDASKKLLIAARDPMGIRPLFYGKNKQGGWCFASEMKAIAEFCNEVKPFPPGHYFDGQKFVCFLDYGAIPIVKNRSKTEIYTNIKNLLVSGVKKRLQSDASIGFLLSGGLDSSLVCAIAQKNSTKPIKTFSIGMEHDAIDAKYAADVAQFIGSHHTNVIMNKNEVLQVVRDVIFHLESWDITTIRASIGMYLVCRYIHQNTDIKVLLTGEVSDELFGYKYTDFAPNAQEFQQEAIKRVHELYLYDVLRADRCISSNSLEARVPFSDKDFVAYVMSIDPSLKMNTTGMGKFILRESFKDEKLLPDHILWRDKAAFSDAVGHSMVDELKKVAAQKYSEEDLKQASKKYPYKTPFSAESLWYREIFEEFYPGRAKVIPDYWMPNSAWKNCDVKDPSARVLPNYGKSGI